MQEMVRVQSINQWYQLISHNDKTWFKKHTNNEWQVPQI